MPNQNELLELLNRFTKREHTLDEVYLFDLILCETCEWSHLQRGCH